MHYVKTENPQLHDLRFNSTVFYSNQLSFLPEQSLCHCFAEQKSLPVASRKDRRGYPIEVMRAKYTSREILIRMLLMCYS